MSYHAQQNTQEKSVGMFIVFAFHVLLVWAIANGLGVKIPSIHIPDPINTNIIDKPAIPIPIPVPVDPIIKPTTTIFTEPVPIDFGQKDTGTPPTVVDRSGGGDMDKFQQPMITKPTIRKATKPEYPSASSRLGESGTTGLQLYIAADGHVTDAQIFKSSGSLRLDTAAVKHVIRSWVFNPCTEDGKAVACAYKTNLTWKLEDAAR